MDVVHLHERALDETVQIVEGVRPDQMGLSTPCTEWDVRVLLAHLVGGNLRWIAIARGESTQRRPAQGGGPSVELLGDDAAGAYRRSAADLKAAWQDLALLDQTFELPIGILPGRAALALHLVETVTHAWDLARATGQDTTFDPEVVRAAMQFAKSKRPPGNAFAAPVAVADDLPEIDRLAAFLGRTP